jgi:hypothetical protein
LSGRLCGLWMVWRGTQYCTRWTLLYQGVRPPSDAETSKILEPAFQKLWDPLKSVVENIKSLPSFEYSIVNVIWWDLENGANAPFSS